MDPARLWPKPAHTLDAVPQRWRPTDLGAALLWPSWPPWPPWHPCLLGSLHPGRDSDNREPSPRGGLGSGVPKVGSLLLREAFDRGDDRHGAVPVQVALGQPELSVAPCLGDGWRSPKGVRVGLCALLNSEKLLLSDNFGEPLQ